MFTNKLKLNPDKTEFMLIGNKCHRNTFDSKFPVDILNNSIPPAAHTKNLGVIIHSDLNFQPHIKNTVKVCNYFIRDIRHVRKHLTLDVSTALANALVSSRLDYCNSTTFPSKSPSKQTATCSKCFSQSCHQVY